MYTKVMILALILSTVSFAGTEPTDGSDAKKVTTAQAAPSGDNCSQDSSIGTLETKPCTTCGCEGYQMGCNCLCHHQGKGSDQKGGKVDDGAKEQPVIGGGDCQI